MMMITVGSMTISMTMMKRDKASLQIEGPETMKAKEDPTIAITMTIGIKGPGMGTETGDPAMTSVTETRIRTAPGTGGPLQTGGGILRGTTLTPGTDTAARNLQIASTNITRFRISSRRDSNLISAMENDE